MGISSSTRPSHQKLRGVSQYCIRMINMCLPFFRKRVDWAWVAEEKAGKFVFQKTKGGEIWVKAGREGENKDEFAKGLANISKTVRGCWEKGFTTD